MKWLKRLVFSVMSAILLVGMVGGLLNQSGVFDVQALQFQVTDVGQETPAALFTADNLVDRLRSQTNAFLQQKVWRIDLPELQRKIGSDEWVRNVQIVRTLPNSVLVTVTPKKARMVVASAQGKLFPIAEDASLLSAIAAKSVPEVPLLRGADFFKDVSAREQAVHFIEQLPQKGLLTEKNIAEVVFNGSEGFSLILINRTLVKIGHDQFSAKLARVNRVLDYLSNKHLKSRVIDASFGKKVLVRLRKDP